MNTSNILNRLKKLEGVYLPDTSEEVSLDEKMSRAKALFEQYHNSSESERQELLDGLNRAGEKEGKTFSHQDMIDGFDSLWLFEL